MSSMMKHEPQVDGRSLEQAIYILRESRERERAQCFVDM